MDGMSGLPVFHLILRTPATSTFLFGRSLAAH